MHSMADHMYGNKLYWEPSPGTLEGVFASSTEPVRILDLGELRSALFTVVLKQCSRRSLLHLVTTTTGSGLTAIWCCAMAETFPDAEVIGVGQSIGESITCLPGSCSLTLLARLYGRRYRAVRAGLSAAVSERSVRTQQRSGLV
jgi:hypothetical protein